MPEVGEVKTVEISAQSSPRLLPRAQIAYSGASAPEGPKLSLSCVYETVCPDWKWVNDPGVKDTLPRFAEKMVT